MAFFGDWETALINLIYGVSNTLYEFHSHKNKFKSHDHEEGIGTAGVVFDERIQMEFCH